MGTYVIRAATDANDREAIGRLRYELYCRQRQWLPADEYPLGVERDAYDEDAIHLLAECDDRIVGTVRLIRNGALGLPVASAFGRPPTGFAGIEDWDRRIGEVSRLAVVDTGVQRHSVFLGLVQALYRQSLADGVAVWLMATDTNARQLAMDRLGIPDGQYASAREYCGSVSVPGAINLAALLYHFQAIWPAMRDFYATDVPPHEIVSRAATVLAGRHYNRARSPGSSVG